MDMPGSYEGRRLEMSGTQPDDSSIRTGGSGGGGGGQQGHPPKDPKPPKN